MSSSFQISGKNPKAAFTLKAHRGDGMLLLAMNWRSGRPPRDFVGFAIEYREPGGERFFALKNRLAFPGVDGRLNPERLSTLQSPIQRFRWVHFPRNAELEGAFTYRVTPLFMNAFDELSAGEAQTLAIELRRDTHPGKLNIAYTRGFVSSQAFVDHYAQAGSLATLLPGLAKDGLDFKPTHPKAKQALGWMGFEARSVLLELLDQAVAHPTAQVRVVAYDLNEPEVVSRLVKLGSRLRIIIDDDGDHAEAGSAENAAEQRLKRSAGAANVKRQHMGKLQHNKTIVVDGTGLRAVLCGSTNFSWRGLYVQNNNVLLARGVKPVQAFTQAFERYWQFDSVADFAREQAAGFVDLGVSGIDAQVAFAPRSAAGALLGKITADIGSTRSSLFYSLAFLAQTPGALADTLRRLTADKRFFVYGMADKQVGGFDLQKPDGTVAPVAPAALGADAPEPFKSEPVGGGGTRMHHKFVVIDFDKPTARVYLGSYNFSNAADRSNGENLLLVRDRRVAVSYMVEALRIFDHYSFRTARERAGPNALTLRRPPRTAGEAPWWQPFWTEPRRVRDREMFAA